MAVTRPFRRTIRQFTDGHYGMGGRWMYIQHEKYARDPAHYIRAFDLIQKDLINIFDYVEPDDCNLSTYSYRIHELFIRACIEVECNFKAILSENGYARTGPWNLKDYRKIEASHFLSSYVVKLPVWRKGIKTIKPFEDWVNDGNPPWYKDYHAAKHDRHRDFTRASLNNLLHAISGLVAVLSAQFLDGCLQPQFAIGASYGPGDGYDGAVGGYFKIKFPDIPVEQRYEFDWQGLQSEADPFTSFNYEA